MTEEILSQAEGINSDELVEEQISEEATLEWADKANIPEAKNTKTNNFKKLLSDKNAAIQRAEEAEAKLANAEFGEEKVEAMITKAMANASATQYKNQERDAFAMQYWDGKLEAVDAVLEMHPTLSYEQAARMEWLEAPKSSNPNRLSFAGNTPAGLKQTKTTGDLDDATLRENMKDELRWMGFAA